MGRKVFWNILYLKPESKCKFVTSVTVYFANRIYILVFHDILTMKSD